jgi:hypothetical protein
MVFGTHSVRQLGASSIEYDWYRRQEAQRYGQVSLGGTTVAAVPHLTIVQAKDHGRPADIKIVDEFLSVIRDVLVLVGVALTRGRTKARKEPGGRGRTEAK